VGGDYYDFVPFSPTRLGVLIGDVSGKGISAAFYMTLTKGIVKTLVREGLSPAEVLIRANQHFYDNAERGIFVSLVFGIFDLQKKKFSFARAGHNPVVIASSNGDSAETLSPPGIALGLEPGEVFARKIVEMAVPIAPGDLFVFYTDGFTEAMNSGREEFGEPRFSKVINGAARESSEVVIERLNSEVKTFAGQVPQHDDMTAIVIKVL
jgi:sigma-B regulation protein RsbU (phosphoserine phosphatase)